MDIDKIYLEEDEHVFGHLSSMRIDQENEYFTWVNDDPKDIRELFYLPNKSELMLIQSGNMGEMNEEVFKDVDWDTSTIYIEGGYGYRPGLMNDSGIVWQSKKRNNIRQL